MQQAIDLHIEYIYIYVYVYMPTQREREKGTQGRGGTPLALGNTRRGNLGTICVYIYIQCACIVHTCIHIPKIPLQVPPCMIYVYIHIFLYSVPYCPIYDETIKYTGSEYHIVSETSL